MKANIFYILIISVSFASCSDLLEEHPKSIAVETFYNTPSEVEAALNAIYDPLHSPAGFGNDYLNLMESCADYAYGRGSWTMVSDYQGLDNTNISRLNTVWSNFYLSIRNANICIQSIPNSSQLTDVQKERYLGEAKFLRAFVYLQLVQNWGGVPLRTEENMEELSLPRASVDEVWALIENDLLYAQEKLPATPRIAGTPSKWSAKTVLTEAYLCLKKYPEALAMAEEVKQSGPYSLVTVSQPGDFHSKLYGPDIVNTTEEIFYIKFSRSNNEGFRFVVSTHHPGSGYIGNNGWYALYSDLEKNLVLKNWDVNDLRYQYNWYLWNTINLGETTVLNRKYRDKANLGEGGIGNDYPAYRYADLLLYYAEAETRVNGVTTKALDALNRVHRRAYGHSPATTSIIDFNTTDFSSSEDLIKEIIKERGYETVFEGKRWKDLKRLGIAKETIRKIKSIEVADKHLLLPIPVVELNYNPAIDPANDQNPGY